MLLAKIPIIINKIRNLPLKRKKQLYAIDLCLQKTNIMKKTTSDSSASVLAPIVAAKEHF